MKFLIPSIFLLILVALTIGITVLSGDTDSVTATVTALNISVDVLDGNVAYGSLALSATNDTLSETDSQWASNDGNVTENLNIKGQNSTAWLLAAAAGDGEYVHRVSTDDGTSYAALTTSYQTLDVGIAKTATKGFELEIQVPSASATLDQQSVDVTVQAVDGS